MNYDMLSQAVGTLQHQVHDLLNAYHDTELSVHEGLSRTTQVRIPHNFFDRWYDDASEGTDTKVAPKASESPQETQQVASDEGKKTLKKEVPQSVSQTVSNTPKASSQASPVSRLKTKKTVKASASDAKSIRHENVIKILKQKGVAKIGDLTAIITDCSSKTLQRDLNELVEEGIVLKKGERRWSTYELRSDI
jgi:translation initiation factor 2B subunit (eIF-2B alpha/beta/delta family)